MKFSGTSEQLFRAVQEGGERFQCIGQIGIPKVARQVASISTLIAGGAVAATLVERKQEKRLKKFVKREVRKAIKARQPRGLCFDLFG